MNIRKATYEDTKGIARVHVDSWRTTYKNIISDRFLNNLSYEKREELWNKNMGQDGNYVFVAENEKGEIVGFATGSKERTGDFPRYDGDVTSLYILENYQGQGIGKKLLKRLFQQFQDLGFNSAIVWVLADNKSRYFYEKMGAEVIVDQKLIKIGENTLNEVAYGWKDIKALINN